MSDTLTTNAGEELRRRRMARERERRELREAKSVAAVAGHRGLPASDAADGRAAVEAAGEAFPAWAALPLAQRAAYFGKAATAIEARAEQIAQDMTAEMGKPLREARLEAMRAATILRFAAGEAWRPIGELYAPSVPDQRLYTLRRPLGVVALITPWNFPIAIPVWKLAPALMHGNTVVLKLGYEAPRTGLHVAECFAEAGLPAGVLNVSPAPARRSEQSSSGTRTCARSRSPARYRSDARCATRRPLATAACSSSSAARTRSS